MAEFGNGIYLTSTWDLDIDETGDIRAAFGQDELEKDLAFRSAVQLDDFVGRPKTKELRLVLEIKAVDIIRQDPRIESVENVDVTFDNAGDKVNISARVKSSDEEQELVFSL